MYSVPVILPKHAVIEVDGIWRERFFPAIRTGRAGSAHLQRARISGGYPRMLRGHLFLARPDIRDIPAGDLRAAPMQSTIGVSFVATIAGANFGP